MTSAVPQIQRWWLDGQALQRVVADLLAAEMALMHPGARGVPAPWPDELDLRSDLGADSLDLMGMASAMETVLHLRRPGLEEEGALLTRTGLRHWSAAARAGLDADGAALTFRTSGSSGAPKPCVHALSALWQETDVLATLFAGRRRIVRLAPAHHIYGFLLTVLLAPRLGLSQQDVVDLRGFAPGAVVRQLQAGDLVVGFPDFWRAVAQADCAVPADVVGVSSGAPCPDGVALGAIAAGLARLVQVYGSSETAGVGWRERPDADYTLFPYWRRGADERLVRALPDGQTGSYALQDRLAWSGATQFRPVGRVDAAVQVGGVNVFPGYVADVLKLHPAVADASVRLMRADEGQRLKAFVVPRPGGNGDGDGDVDGDALRASLAAWLAARLSAPECPAAISVGPSLPRGAGGKLTDWIIEAWL